MVSHSTTNSTLSCLFNSFHPLFPPSLSTIIKFLSLSIKSPMALQGKSVPSPSSNPLFSTIITLYTLILLYLPSILYSPLFLSTSLLILSLLTIAETHKTNQHDEKKPNSDEFIQDCKWVSRESDPKPDPFSFMEWNVGAPLEVIHEECGDEEEIGVIYPDTDTGTGTDTDTDSSLGGDSPVIGNWDSPGNLCFQWEEEEEDREGLIEIELDGKRSIEVEEENLIEIDLTPANSPAR